MTPCLRFPGMGITTDYLRSVNIATFFARISEATGSIAIVMTGRSANIAQE